MARAPPLRPARDGQQRLALLAGMFFAADLIFWHQAIADVGAGLATVLGNLQVVIVPVRRLGGAVARRRGGGSSPRCR